MSIKSKFVYLWAYPEFRAGLVWVGVWIVFALAVGVSVWGEDSPKPPAVIELTKEEALELITTRDRLEDAMRTAQELRTHWNLAWKRICVKYGADPAGWRWNPVKGQILPPVPDKKK